MIQTVMQPTQMVNPSRKQPTHGGQVYAFAEQQKIAVQQVLDFSASINPNVPNIDWQTLQKQANIELIHYPQEFDSNSPSVLKPLIAQRFQIHSQHITLCKGISETIHQLCATLCTVNSVLFCPIYSEYQKALKKTSTNLFNVDCAPQDWLHSNQAKTLPAGSLLVLVNPSTPAGNMLCGSQLDAILAFCQKQQHWLIIDESFLPFIGFEREKSARQYLNHYPGLIILQSLTKYYACPGLRIGAIFSSSPTISQHIKSVWSLSTLDRLWLMQAITDTDHQRHTQQWMSQTKPNFLQQLKTLPCILKVEPSKTNFFLVKFDRPVKLVQAHLTPHKILIRDVTSFGYSPNFARIAIKHPIDNQKLIQALQSIGELCDI